MEDFREYERIIIGAGAAGLYFAASCSGKKGIILEKEAAAGKKLLLSGSGQCNLTHGGSIKDFIGHYGENGKKIRTALYQAGNLQVKKFFEGYGMELIERPDGKVFPSSMRASDVLDLLLQKSRENGWDMKTGCPVTALSLEKDGKFLINDRFLARQVIIACGGCSVPASGSDGSIFPLLEHMGLNILSPRPSLVPVMVQEYPYSSLSGISFQNARVRIGEHRLTGDLLLTHNGFSGPAVLNLSRYACPGNSLSIEYVPEASIHPEGDRRQCASFLSETFRLPRRFVEMLLQRADIPLEKKAASLSKKEKNRLARLLTCDTFSISGTAGFGAAMATCGGICLDEINLKTFESKKYPGLYIIGETLDIDGDTGGYNLQFAFSSACLAAKNSREAARSYIG